MEGRDDDVKCYVLRMFVDVWVRLMVLFMFYISEEFWEKFGGEGFVSFVFWFELVLEWWNEMVEVEEDFVKFFIEDIKEIIIVVKIENLKRVYIYIVLEWKWRVVEVVVEKRDFKVVMVELMKDFEMRKYGKEVSKFI